jgi:hypothetical protein
MRTTVNLDEDALRAARSLARQCGKSLGAVISDLIRDALRPSRTIAYDEELPVFRVREDAPPITSEMVASALEES